MTGRERPERTDAERAALLDKPAWSPAMFPGVCARCGTPFLVGTPIAYEGHELGWRADCCAVAS